MRKLSLLRLRKLPQGNKVKNKVSLDLDPDPPTLYFNATPCTF